MCPFISLQTAPSRAFSSGIARQRLTLTHKPTSFPLKRPRATFASESMTLSTFCTIKPVPPTTTGVNATLANASRPTQRKQRTLARGTSNALYSYAHEGCKGQIWVDFMIHTHRAVSWRVCGGQVGQRWAQCLYCSHPWSYWHAQRLKGVYLKAISSYFHIIILAVVMTHDAV